MKESKSKQSDFRKGEDSFILIEASKIIRSKDTFLHYKTKTLEEQKLKEMLTIISRRGIKDFCCSIYSPSFISSNEKIQFVKSEESQTEKSIYDWIKPVRKYCPQRYSRIATKIHYASILGVIMKELVNTGCDKESVWNAFCNENKKIQDFLTKKEDDDSKRKIDLLYNLISRQNILLDSEREDVFWITNRKIGSISHLSCAVNKYARSKDIPLIIMDVISPKN